MFREMRRKDRLIATDEALEILNNNTYGILSTIGENGYPYGVPISYVFYNDSIYFHCAAKGHKLDNITNNNNVSFTVVGHTRTLPDEFSSEYESVVVFGKAAEIFDNEKDEALLKIILKYSTDYLEKGEEYIQKAGNATRVMKIYIEHMSGKANKGK